MLYTGLTDLVREGSPLEERTVVSGFGVRCRLRKFEGTGSVDFFHFTDHEQK